MVLSVKQLALTIYANQLICNCLCTYVRNMYSTINLFLYIVYINNNGINFCYIKELYILNFHIITNTNLI